MDNIAMSIILSIAGAVMMIMTGIIGFFLQQLLKKVDVMANTIESILERFAASSSDFKNLTGNCATKHDLINTRLNDHSKRISETEKDIICIKSKSN